MFLYKHTLCIVCYTVTCVDPQFIYVFKDLISGNQLNKRTVYVCSTNYIMIRYTMVQTYVYFRYAMKSHHMHLIRVG